MQPLRTSVPLPANADESRHNINRINCLKLLVAAIAVPQIFDNQQFAEGAQIAEV
jgi:hypothetical protein